MDTADYRTLKRSMLRGALCATAAAALLSATASVRADDPVTMAPPVQSAGDGGVSPGLQGDDAVIDRTASNVSADTVFNWKEVPANQQVPVRRAVFDRGGYQIYDKAGETIVVPFANNNLYVMKFAQSHDGSMYFVNEGDNPVLYVPKDGYLENATVAGARWYPFSKDFHPETPVFVGIAPSWDDYCGMGWYPNMVCYGGYFCNRPFIGGGIFVATPGFLLVIGEHRCYGWDPFVSYCGYHPAPYRIAFYDEHVYRWADRPYWDRRAFYGSGHPYWVHNEFGGGREFRGYRGYHDGRVTEPIRGYHDGRGMTSDRGFHDGRVTEPAGGFREAHNFDGQRTFRGVRGFDGSQSGGDHGFGGGRPNDDHGFSGSRPTFGGGQTNNDHGFGGSRPTSGGGSENRPSFGGGSESRPTFYGGGRPSGGETHTFSGGGSRSWSGGESHGYSSGGGGRGYSGGGGGGRSYSGGGRSGGGFGGDHGGGGGGFSGNRR